METVKITKFEDLELRDSVCGRLAFMHSVYGMTLYNGMCQNGRDGEEYGDKEKRYEYFV